MRKTAGDTSVICTRKLVQSPMREKGRWNSSRLGSETTQIYRLLSSIGGHHIVAASKGKPQKDMRNEWSGAATGITV